MRIKNESSLFFALFRVTINYYHCYHHLLRLQILLIWLIVGFPLTVLGGILGRKAAGAFDAPTRTKSIHREIPEVPLYKGWLAQS